MNLPPDPYAVNKVIINDLRTQGDHAAILKEFEVGRHLGEQIERAGIAHKTRGFKDKIREYCKAHEEADRKFLDELRAIFDEMEDWLDDELDAQRAKP